MPLVPGFPLGLACLIMIFAIPAIKYMIYCRYSLPLLQISESSPIEVLLYPHKYMSDQDIGCNSEMFISEAWN
ncbi:hypothetical protein F5890DRAFT_1498258 [Lentinula detonsa]|uniref:Uncharacterized protein n=1 Tax=Lentinula detonsa TaxID=2804962 RepID=A0AA38Q5T9_9AGAR|nr:hypothetical protein F5890DRAFT_1498258 [Lentinula detonsa]